MQTPRLDEVRTAYPINCVRFERIKSLLWWRKFSSLGPSCFAIGIAPIAFNRSRRFIFDHPCNPAFLECLACFSLGSGFGRYG